MIKISSPEMCCGCSACSSVCGTGAISMRRDRLGFLYPEVELSKCVDCGVCNRVCPFNGVDDESCHFASPMAFGVRSRDMSRLMGSRSGGLFATLADYVLGVGGVVCGAAFDSDFNVRHFLIEKREEYCKLQGSKYAQSDMSAIINSAIDELYRGRFMLFSGTPCQIAAMKRVVGERFPRQILYVDVVCHGVASPKIWKEYIDYWEQVVGDKVVDAEFRDKRRFGWRAHVERLSFSGRTIYSDCFATLFYKHVMLRDSCHVCPFASLKREGDITLADFWGWERSLSEFNSDNRGASLALVSTHFGLDMLQKVADNLDIVSVGLDAAMQPNLQKPTPRSSDSEHFVETYLHEGFEYAIKKFVGIGEYTFKVGISTFHCAHNYGAMLQAYALQQFLLSLGYNTVIVDYRLPAIYRNYTLCSYSEVGNPLRWLRRLGGYMKRRLFDRRWRRFNGFLENYLIKSKRVDSPDIPSGLELDAIVCGSDQIWNRDLTEEFVPLYFAQGMPFHTKRIAYAASNGEGDIKEDEWSVVEPMLRNFDAISVREGALSSFLKQRGFNAIEMLDPVFLLNADRWDTIAKRPKIDGYILIYSFAECGGFSDEVRRVCETMPDKSVIHITYNNRGIGIKGDYRVVKNAGPLEFLGYIAQSGFVITNSFHGTAFSLLYGKGLYVSRPVRGGDRIESLIKSMGCEWRDGYVSADVDMVRDKIVQYRKHATEFLRSSIESESNKDFW